MDQNTVTILTFAVYLLLMLGIGVYAWLKTQSLSDYILGGRKLGPWVSALSAGASDMSGWLLLGLPGLAYTSGMGAIWIASGLLLGTWGNWFIMVKRIRAFSIRAGNALTLSAYLEHRFNDKKHLLRSISALVILVFFTIYTASGLIAGGKLFEEVFGLPYHYAVLTGLIAVVSYTLFGGFLAVSLTDVVQGLLMSAALLIVPLYTIQVSGGFGHCFDVFSKTNNGALLDMFTDRNGQSYSLIAILSFVGWGLGYMGQPHILARYKAIRSPKDIPAARRIATSWTAFCLLGASFSGLAGLAFFDAQLADPETVFMNLVNTVFHPVPAGILLAAILAAIMSTADSQLLVASSALAEDFYKTFLHKDASAKTLVNVGRLAVVIIAVISMTLALDSESLVLDVAALAWAGFGGAFGPTLALSLYWRGMTRLGALMGMTTGGLTVLIWHNLQGGIFELYEIVPAVIISTLAIIGTSLVTNQDTETEAIYDLAIQDIKETI